VVQGFRTTFLSVLGQSLLSSADYGQAKATRPLDLPSASHEAESDGIPGYCT